jgi:Zn-dependent protease with chaperone function
VNCGVMELEQQTKFDLLVRRLERSSRQQKTTNYRLRVAALAAIGYGYIGLICLALFSSLWGVQWLVESIQHRPIQIDPHQLWLLFGLVAIATFWVQYTPLKDREIYRHEFPELFAAIDDLRDRLNAPPIHHVVINSDHNAAIYQAPRLGWFGWYRNYLILGVPLLQSLSPEQFKSTLAHELGHLSGNDSRFAGWIYQARHMWEQLTHDNDLFILSWFFRWYEPLIKAYSFVLIRDREYAADALAKRLTSPEVTASDLIQTYIYQYYLQECFSQQLDRQAQASDTPPADVVTQMLAALRQPLDPQAARIWLGLALGEATDTDDTHPCLSDRLAAVGYPVPTNWIPQPISITAAEHFFGDRLADLATELDAQWAKSHQTTWGQQYQRAQYQREYLATLNLQAATQPLSLTGAFSQAELTTELHGDLQALPLWYELLAREPNHPQPNYQVGRILVSRGHQSGCVYLERAIELDPDLVIPSCERLYRFYTYQNDLATAEIYRDWRQQYLPKQWRSKLEHKIKDTDLFIPHDLDPELVAEIRHQLARYPIVDRAYLVRKPMQIFPERPLYILGIKLINPSTDNQHRSKQAKIAVSESTEQIICQKLQVEINFGKHLLIATFDSQKFTSTSRQDLKLLQNIEQIANASIFSRGNS